jgi:hypothetical protein
MRKLKLFAAAGLLAVTAVAPVLADEAPVRRHRHHHYHHYWRALPYPISYLHNYGPGPLPGTFAYYDGPSSVKCYQSAAVYIGQDRRRHPCF